MLTRVGLSRPKGGAELGLADGRMVQPGRRGTTSVPGLPGTFVADIFLGESSTASIVGRFPKSASCSRNVGTTAGSSGSGRPNERTPTDRLRKLATPVRSILTHTRPLAIVLAGVGQNGRSSPPWDFSFVAETALSP